MISTQNESYDPQASVAAEGVPPTRKVRPGLAFLLTFLALGLGYVYVGELGFALAAVAGVYGTLALFAWTRLLVSTTTAYWTCVSVMFLVYGTALIHPAVLAETSRYAVSKRYNKWWFYLVWIVVIGAASFALTRNREQVFGYGTFRVPSVSMSPTVESGDFIIVDTWRYRAHTPTRGELVVFERGDASGIVYVKRIVGVAGDHVELRDSILYINGETVKEPYLHSVGSFPVNGGRFEPIVISSGEVFVLGDFRDNSMDSRQWGAIAVKHIHGRAQFIWFSYDAGKVRWDRIGKDLRPH